MDQDILVATAQNLREKQLGGAANANSRLDAWMKNRSGRAGGKMHDQLAPSRGALIEDPDGQNLNPTGRPEKPGRTPAYVRLDEARACCVYRKRPAGSCRFVRNSCSSFVILRSA